MNFLKLIYCLFIIKTELWELISVLWGPVPDELLRTGLLALKWQVTSLDLNIFGFHETISGLKSTHIIFAICSFLFPGLLLQGIFCEWRSCPYFLMVKFENLLWKDISDSVGKYRIKRLINRMLNNQSSSIKIWLQLMQSQVCVSLCAPGTSQIHNANPPYFSS